MTVKSRKEFIVLYRNCEKHGEIGFENEWEPRKGKRRNYLFRIMLVFLPPLDGQFC